MPKVDAKKFIDQVNNDEKLQKQLQNILQQQAEKQTNNLVEFAAELGYKFSGEEMEILVTEQIMKDDQLSAEELEAVVGGLSVQIGLVDQELIDKLFPDLERRTRPLPTYTVEVKKEE